MNLQQPPLGQSHLILGDSLVRVLSNLRTSWVTTVIAFGGATIAQLYRMVELMNPGKIPNVMILVGTNDISRGSDEQEALWESMMVCLFTTLWQKFSCAGTDRLHCANEREKSDSIRKKAQRGSHKMEQHLEEPSKSKCRKG